MLRDTKRVLPGNSSPIDAEVAQAEEPASPAAAENRTTVSEHLDPVELDRKRQSGEKLTPSGFRTLRWLAIVLPFLFIVGLNILLHTTLHMFHDFPGVLVVLGLLVILTGAFSFAVFGLVERLERRILERNAMLAALVAIGREAGSSLDLDELLDNSLAAILEITSAEAAEVWLTDGESELVMAHHRGLGRDAFRERVRLRFGEGLPGLVAQQGSPIVVHNLQEEQRFVRSGVKRLGFESFCALPLRHRDETYGVLCVAARDRKAMKDEVERGLLEGIAERLAAAIESSRLHERVLDAAVLQERERIARELHDGLAQVLGYINTQTLAVRKLLASGRIDEASVQLETMEKAAKRVYGDVREGIFSLRTPLGRSDRLTDAVRAHLDNYREMPGAPATLEVVEDGELPVLAPRRRDPADVDRSGGAQQRSQPRRSGQRDRRVLRRGRRADRLGRGRRPRLQAGAADAHRLAALRPADDARARRGDRGALRDRLDVQPGHGGVRPLSQMNGALNESPAR